MMGTEELQVIMDAISKLGDTGANVFLWYLGVSFAETLFNWICSGVVVVLVARQICKTMIKMKEIM